MTGSLRQSMAWVHGWLGLLAGWIVFAMFLTGTSSYFRPEITRWMQPELHLRPVAPEQAARTAVAYLQTIAPNAEQWYVYLPDDRTPATRIYIRERANTDLKAPPRKQWPEIRLDPATGQPLAARDTYGGEQFFRFHFQLQLPHPWGRWLSGLCAMAMLGAIISGVITHKRIFTDFFTLRWSKRQRSWLDVHNVTAVFALPFHAMITYTGLITLVTMYMPWPIAANYADPSAFQAEAYGELPKGEPSGRSASLTDVGALVAAATQQWSASPPAIMVVRYPNDAASSVTLQRTWRDSLNARTGMIVYSGANGARLSASPPQGPAVATAGVMFGLHVGVFAGPVLRWSYFLLGLTGTAMVGTGLVLWTVKRRRTHTAPFLGLALVERLNIGVIACLPAGMAAYLLANRLLPAAMPGRADVEVGAMFWTWFGLAAAACLRPVSRAWVETLVVAAAAFGAIPIVSALTTDRGLPGSIARGDTLFVAFDLAMLAVAGLLAFAAARVGGLGARSAEVRQSAGEPAPRLAKLADAA